MKKDKIQVYDLTENTKKAIAEKCRTEERSASFIVSRILNKMFDPIEENICKK